MSPEYRIAVGAMEKEVLAYALGFTWKAPESQPQLQPS